MNAVGRLAQNDGDPQVCLSALDTLEVWMNRQPEKSEEIGRMLMQVAAKSDNSAVTRQAAFLLAQHTEQPADIPDALEMQRKSEPASSKFPETIQR